MNLPRALLKLLRAIPGFRALALEVVLGPPFPRSDHPADAGSGIRVQLGLPETIPWPDGPRPWGDSQSPFDLLAPKRKR